MATPVKLITYNTHLFGGTIPATIGGQGYEDEERMGRILGELQREAPDIVCLQEVWSDDARRWFVDNAGGQFVGHYFPDDNKGVKISSGLLILAKGSVHETVFVPFKAASGADGWATKGCIGGTVRRGGEVLAHVMTMHAQADAGHTEEQVRKEQFRQVIELIHEQKQKHGWKGQPVILCGDFNVIGETKGGGWATSEYRVINKMLEDAGMTDVFRSVHPAEQKPVDPGYTLNRYTNKLAQHFDPDGVPKLQRLDYVYANLAESGIAVRSCAVRSRGWVYPTGAGLMNDSDHFPVVMEYELGVAG